jgi:hypothetical protein
MSIAILSAEYPGDHAWGEFTRAVGAHDAEIRTVVTAIMGRDGEGWFNSALPVLEGRSPHEVLVREPNGASIIRSLIMRLP